MGHSTEFYREETKFAGEIFNENGSLELRGHFKQLFSMFKLRYAGTRHRGMRHYAIIPALRRLMQEVSLPRATQ